LALCVQGSVIRNLNLIRGIKTLRITSTIGTDNLISDAIQFAVRQGYTESGDQILCLLGENEDSPENINLMKVFTFE